MRRFVVVLAILCLGVFASSASARRGAHGAEKRNVERAVFPKDLPPLGCDDVWISSVSRFWAVDYYQPSGQASCGHWATGKRTFLKHVPGGWRSWHDAVASIVRTQPASPESQTRSSETCSAVPPRQSRRPRTDTDADADADADADRVSPTDRLRNCYEPGGNIAATPTTAGERSRRRRRGDHPCEDNNGWRWEPS